MGLAAAGVATYNNLLSIVPKWNVKPKEQETQSFAGRCYKVFSREFGGWTDVTSHTETFHSAIKFIVSAAAAVQPAIFLKKVSITFSETDRFIDGLRFISDITSVMKGEIITEALSGRIASSASKIAFLLADFGASVSLLGYLGFVDLNVVLASMGGLAIFGAAAPAIVGAIIIGTYALHFQTAAFFFLGIQTYTDLSEKNDGKEHRNQLWLATCVAEVFHKSFMFSNASALHTPIGLMASGFLGMVANGLGVASAYVDIKGTPSMKQNPK